MANLERTVKLFEDFKQQFNSPNPDLPQSKKLMDQLKVWLLIMGVVTSGSHMWLVGFASTFYPSPWF